MADLLKWMSTKYAARVVLVMMHMAGQAWEMAQVG